MHQGEECSPSECYSRRGYDRPPMPASKDETLLVRSEQQMICCHKCDPTTFGHACGLHLDRHVVYVLEFANDSLRHVNLMCKLVCSTNFCWRLCCANLKIRRKCYCFFSSFLSSLCYSCDSKPLWLWYHMYYTHLLPMWEQYTTFFTFGNTS